MYGCKIWAIRKAECQSTDAFQLWCYVRLLRILLDSKEIKPVIPKGNQPWIFTGKTDAEVPILGLPDAKSRLTGKDLGDGKDWRQEKGTRKDEMVGWHHWLTGHEFEQASGDGEGQGSLACHSPQGCKESDTTEQLKNKGWLYLLMGSCQLHILTY